MQSFVHNERRVWSVEMQGFGVEVFARPSSDRLPDLPDARQVCTIGPEPTVVSLEVQSDYDHLAAIRLRLFGLTPIMYLHRLVLEGDGGRTIFDSRSGEPGPVSSVTWHRVGEDGDENWLLRCPETSADLDFEWPSEERVLSLTVHLSLSEADPLRAFDDLSAATAKRLKAEGELRLVSESLNAGATELGRIASSMAALFSRSAAIGPRDVTPNSSGSPGLIARSDGRSGPESVSGALDKAAEHVWAASSSAYPDASGQPPLPDRTANGVDHDGSDGPEALRNLLIEEFGRLHRRMEVQDRLRSTADELNYELLRLTLDDIAMTARRNEIARRAEMAGGGKQ